MGGTVARNERGGGGEVDVGGYGRKGKRIRGNAKDNKETGGVDGGEEDGGGKAGRGERGEEEEREKVCLEDEGVAALMNGMILWWGG